MNFYAIRAIYLHEMDRMRRTLFQSILSPVISTSKIFADLLSAAKASSGKSKKKLENQGLKRQAELTQLRAQIITDYRAMRGRPMNNGRNEKLASNPTKLFASGSSLQGGNGVSAAQLRKDRR